MTLSITDVAVIICKIDQIIFIRTSVRYGVTFLSNVCNWLSNHLTYI